MYRYMKSIIAAGALIFSAQADADIYALKDVYKAGASIVNAITIKDVYIPVYQIQVTAVAGDILRLSGQVEGTERGTADEHGLRTKVWAYLAVRPSSTQTRTRVSSYAYQIAAKESNHHMPLNLYGYYAVPASGDYIVEVMARFTLSDTIVDIESTYGHIIVEQYRPYVSVQDALDDQARLLVDTDDKALQPYSVGQNEVQEGEPFTTLFPTKDFNVSSGDILRAQGALTAEFDTRDALYALSLHVQNDTTTFDEQLTRCTENITSTLYRFTAQNDASFKYVAADDTSVPRHFILKTHTQAEDDNEIHKIFQLPANQNDLIAMHFSKNIPASGGSYLLSSRNLPTSATADFHTSDTTITLLTASGTQQAGDTFRVNSQLQLEIVDGYGAAACWGQILIYVGGRLAYQSMRDQRYMRNFADSSDPDFHLKDHQLGAMSPFALYTTEESGTYQIKLVSDCSSSAGVTMQAAANGRHLNIDQFRVNQ